MAVNMESLVARLEAVAARLEAQAGAPAPAKGTATQSAASPGTVHPSVAAFDEILTGPLKALTTAAGTLNEPEIADATTLFADAFNAERRMHRVHRGVQETHDGRPATTAPARR